ncbi:uncharacterized protein LOC116129494 [Pistacia vera]|uniref:uncharacterized protein LOC116129494 n=1 Tax=Pistacia vera TaxID=55513 RepID=UPI001263DFB7|nr:uncharacterized protein LOC116129494 [Pistacia vera]
MASPVVTLALGKVSGMSESFFKKKKGIWFDEELDNAAIYGYIVGWWAPLLLVQIGSPNILFYSIEDNKLKLRQVVGLTSQVAVALWIFYKVWFPDSYLYAAVLPLYVAGIIKVIDTLQALRSLSNSENVVITTMENSDIQKLEIPTESSSSSSNRVSGTYSDDVALLVKAYQRFDRLKPYLEKWLGHPSSIYLPSISVDDYLPKDVFKLIEFELSFMYDVLYTKSPINYSIRSLLGRIICTLLLANFLLHSVRTFGRVYSIIYVVLGTGVVALEIYEIKELLYSDWAILHLMKQNRSAFMRRLLRIVARKVISKKHRWSQCIDQFNLLSYCLYEEATKFDGLISRILKFKGYYKVYKKYCVKKDIQVPEELKELILQQMEEIKAQRDGQPFSESGQWLVERCYCLRDLEWSTQTDFGTQAKKQTTFGKTIITWHLATTVCYYLEDDQSEGTSTHSQREMSKNLSDYIMYLLAMQPDMLSIVIGDILFRGARAQVGEFVKTKQLKDEATLCSTIILDELIIDENYFQGLPKNNMLTSQWNVLHQVQDLARKLQDREDRWRIISSVWVEILCHGASICPWTLHAEQLRRGGELLTHVWLLLEHEKDRSNNVLSHELESAA